MDPFAKLEIGGQSQRLCVCVRACCRDQSLRKGGLGSKIRTTVDLLRHLNWMICLWPRRHSAMLKYMFLLNLLKTCCPCFPCSRAPGRLLHQVRAGHHRPQQGSDVWHDGMRGETTFGLPDTKASHRDKGDNNYSKSERTKLREN